MSLPATPTVCTTKIKKTHTPNGNDTNVDATGTYGKRQRGRALQPGETKVPEDQASALRGKALEQFLESEPGRTLSAREQQVLRFLSSKANKGFHWIQDNRLCSDCFWQQKNIAAALGCKSEATIARAIKGLKAAGIVNSHRKKFYVNTYIVQLPLPTESFTKPTKAPVSKPAEESVTKPTKLSVSLTSSSIQPSKKEPTPPSTRTSEPTASANTSSIEPSGGGGVVSFEESGRAEPDEQENERVSDAVNVLMSNGWTVKSQAIKLVKSNKQITAEVVQDMLNAIDSNPENPIALVRLRLQEPEDVQDVVEEMAALKVRKQHIERERQAAAARKAAEEKAEAARKYINELTMFRARQRMLAMTDARIWCIWTKHIEEADFNEQKMQRIRHRIANDAWHFLAKMMHAIGMTVDEQETLRQHVVNGTAIEDLKNLPLKCDRDDDKEQRALAKVQQHIELMKLTPEQRNEARMAEAEQRIKARMAGHSVEQQVTTGGGK